MMMTLQRIRSAAAAVVVLACCLLTSRAPAQLQSPTHDTTVPLDAEETTWSEPSPTHSWESPTGLSLPADSRFSSTTSGRGGSISVTTETAGSIRLHEVMSHAVIAATSSPMELHAEQAAMNTPMPATPSREAAEAETTTTTATTITTPTTTRCTLSIAFLASDIGIAESSAPLVGEDEVTSALAGYGVSSSDLERTPIDGPMFLAGEASLPLGLTGTSSQVEGGKLSASLEAYPSGPGVFVITVELKGPDKAKRLLRHTYEQRVGDPVILGVTGSKDRVMIVTCINDCGL